MDADLKTHPALGWDYYRSICFSLKMMDAPTPLIKLQDGILYFLGTPSSLACTYKLAQDDLSTDVQSYSCNLHMNARVTRRLMARLFDPQVGFRNLSEPLASHQLQP
jgi:hypothetical protein